MCSFYLKYFPATFISMKSLFPLNGRLVGQLLCFSAQFCSQQSSLCVTNWGEKSSEIPWKSLNPGNCNEGVARLQSIGPIVYSCMDSVVLQGASMTHNALQIPLLFRINKGEWGLIPWFVLQNLNPAPLFTKITIKIRRKKCALFNVSNVP